MCTTRRQPSRVLVVDAEQGRVGGAEYINSLPSAIREARAIRELGRSHAVLHVRDKARWAGQLCPIRLIGRGWPSLGAALGFY